MIGQHERHELDVPYEAIWMDCGQKNSRRYINVTSIQRNLEEKCQGLSTALVGLHAMTGSDFTSSFYNKGKIKGLKLLQRDEKHGLVEAFQHFGEQEELSSAKYELFVAGLYGFPNCKDLNAARCQKLFKLAGWKKGEKPNKEKLKKINCALLPPCVNTLKLKILRAQYISTIWTRATKRNPSHGLDPLKSGWQKDESGCYEPTWYNGPLMPEIIPIADKKDKKKEPDDELEADAKAEVDYISSSDDDDDYDDDEELDE